MGWLQEIEVGKLNRREVPVSDSELAEYKAGYKRKYGKRVIYRKTKNLLPRYQWRSFVKLFYEFGDNVRFRYRNAWDFLVELYLAESKPSEQVFDVLAELVENGWLKAPEENVLQIKAVTMSSLFPKDKLKRLDDILLECKPPAQIVKEIASSPKAIEERVLWELFKEEGLKLEDIPKEDFERHE